MRHLFYTTSHRCGRIRVRYVQRLILKKTARCDQCCSLWVSQKAQINRVHFHSSTTMPKPKANGKPKRGAPSQHNGHVDKRSRTGHSDTSATPSTLSQGLSSKTNPVRTAPVVVVPSTGPPAQTLFHLHTGVSVMQQQTSNPPSVVLAMNNSTAQNEVNTEHESKTWFEACQRNGQMDNEEMCTKDIGSYVRYELFPKLKFIMNSKQLNYSSDKSSICGLICHAMGLVDEKTSVSWWERYKDMIADVLNAKRADATGAMKRVFLSKYL